jgi:hypothetical protein
MLFNVTIWSKYDTSCSNLTMDLVVSGCVYVPFLSSSSSAITTNYYLNYAHTCVLLHLYTYEAFVSPRAKQFHEIKKTSLENNQITNSALCDAANSVISFHNATRRHATSVNIISLTPVRKVRSSRALISMELKTAQRHCVQISYTELHNVQQRRVDLKWSSPCLQSR